MRPSNAIYRGHVGTLVLKIFLTNNMIRFWCSPAMARDGELIQTQYFCHHAETIWHPNSSYITTKLYETSACGCNNNTIFQNELFLRFLPSTHVAWHRRSLGDAAKVARWRHQWIHNFSCLKFCLCVTTVSNIMIMYSEIHLERGFASMPRPPVKRHTIFCHACPSPALLSTACAIIIIIIIFILYSAKSIQFKALHT